MKIILLIISVFLISGCLYSFEGECFRPIIQVVSSNCYKKGEVFSSIAHYQKPYSIGKLISNSVGKMLLAVVVNMEIKNFTTLIKLVNTKNFNLVWKGKDIKDFGPQNAVIKIPNGIRGYVMNSLCYCNSGIRTICFIRCNVIRYV